MRVRGSFTVTVATLMRSVSFPLTLTTTLSNKSFYIIINTYHVLLLLILLLYVVIPGEALPAR